MVNLEEQFSLKWNDFQSNLTAGFQHLLQEEVMLDVTLSAGGQLVQAHKIVLSICSSYFKTLFQVTPCKHPVIILKDVGVQELLDMMDFMYKGEAKIQKDNLAAFLRLAENLKVKGLADGRKEEEEVEMSKSSRVKKKCSSSQDTSDSSTSFIKKKKRRLSLLKGESVSKIALTEKHEKSIGESECEVVSVAERSRSSKVEVAEPQSCHDDDDFGDNSNDEFPLRPGTPDDSVEVEASDEAKMRAPIWEYFMREDNSVVCQICSKSLPMKKSWGTGNMKRHLKLHPDFYVELREKMKKAMVKRQEASLKAYSYYFNFTDKQQNTRLDVKYT